MIETNIPIPATSKGGIQKYPFVDLQPGESVLVKCTMKEKSTIRKAPYRIAKYYGWKIVVRSLPEGIRVWRLE